VSPWLRRRQALDRLVAGLLGLAAAPLIAVLAVLARRGSTGPGLVGLVRVGQGGVPFRIWKVRTMVADAPDGAAGGAPITSAGDPRITGLGRRLRSYRLDELPQLWNVVGGEMSLLGPRPEAPGYVDLDDARWCAVLQARPGIAGPTQLLVADWEAALIGSGPGDAYADRVLPVKLAIDQWYVERATPAVDLAIVSGLVQRFLLGRPPAALLRLVEAAVPQAAQVQGR
jgi:lipopolysaccharide/colanic/teichoic acid biosynthesis glycosyltransferase